jgi:hypothetical protein
MQFVHARELLFHHIAAHALHNRVDGMVGFASLYVVDVSLNSRSTLLTG